MGDDDRRAPLARSMSRSSLRSAGAAATSSAAIGSSSSSSRGSAARARATATRCAWPPDSWAGLRSARCSASTASSQRRASSRASDAAAALAPRRVGDVGGGGQVREQQRLLGQHRDTPRVRRRRTLPASVSVTTVPPSAIRPSSGRSSPAISDSSVDLPAPLGPSTASTSPSSSVDVELDAALHPRGRRRRTPAHSGPASRRDWPRR